jgi:unsaturated rhamnogalacturonyl hydrolase
MTLFRNCAISIFALTLCASLATPAQSATSFPRRTEILSLMHRADNYQLENPVMPPTDRNWERGTWYTGVMEAWKATHDEAFFKQALDWGKQNQWQIGTEKLGANRLFCSETWTELYLAKHNPPAHDAAMLAPTETSLATPVPNSPAGAKRWYLDGGKPYVDSLYGAVVFAMLTRATGKQEYLATMRAFFDDVSGELWDQESGLYYRDPTYIGKLTAHGHKVLWSRGNGWAFAGIARLLEYLPKNDPQRQKLLAIYQRMAAELFKRQSPDGFWRANLDDPEDVPNPESSGTAFFCFGLAWGINHHILDRQTYLPATRSAYAALANAIGPDGRVQWGQQVDARPNPAQRSSTHEYVTGAFLLASGEVYKLAK